MGKIGKSYHGRYYKKALAVHSKQEQEGIGENIENREIVKTKKTKETNKGN